MEANSDSPVACSPSHPQDRGRRTFKRQRTTQQTSSRRDELSKYLLAFVTGQLHLRSHPMRSCRCTHPCLSCLPFLQYGCCSLAEDANAGHLATRCKSPQIDLTRLLTWHLPSRDESSETRNRFGGYCRPSLRPFCQEYNHESQRLYTASWPYGLTASLLGIQSHLS